MHRRNVDDAPPVFLFHVWQRQARGMKGAAQVDGNDGIPAFNRKVFYGCHVLDTCVVDQDVYTCGCICCKLHHGFDLGNFAHVCTVVVNLNSKSF